MKRLILLIAAASLAFAIVGCKKSEDSSSPAAPAAGSKLKDKTPSAGDE